MFLAHTSPIFVIGCVRSGTTLLRAMLNAHPSIAIPYEPFSFSRIISTRSPWNCRWSRENVRQPIEEFLAYPAVRFWQLGTSAVLAELGEGEVFGYGDLLRAIYSAYARRAGKPRWGDKKPANFYEMPHLAHAFPGAQFVHISRDGRDVYLSLQDMIQRGVSWALNWQGVGAVAKKWAWRERCAAVEGRRLGPSRYYHLRYEDLIQDPKPVLQVICRFLGEPFSDQMLEYHQVAGLVPPDVEKSQNERLSRPPDASRAFRWKREMPQAERRVFERIAGATLLRYNYEVSPRIRPTAYLRFLAQSGRQCVRDLLVPAT